MGICAPPLDDFIRMKIVPHVMAVSSTSDSNEFDCTGVSSTSVAILLSEYFNTFHSGSPCRNRGSSGPTLVLSPLNND